MKNKILISLITTFVLFSWKSNTSQEKQMESTKTVLKGNIVGYSQPLWIYGKNESFEITLDSLGNFYKEFETIENGTYSIPFGMENRFEIYLKENSVLNLEIDYDKIVSREKNAIKASGVNIEETLLLINLYERKPSNNYNRVAYKNEYLPKVNTKNPEDFEAYQLQKFKESKEFIKDFKQGHPNLDAEFVEILELDNLLSFNTRFKLYENYHKYFAPDTKVEIPEKFKDYFADQIPQNDFDLYEKSGTYNSYIREQYYAILSEQLKEYPRGSLAYYKAEVDFLEASGFPEVIKESMFNGLTVGYMNSQDPVTKAWLDQTISEKVSDKAALERYNIYKAKEAGYKDGDMAPNFTYNDINGKAVSLSDFKGKVVYIDLWATWCGPCIKGLPYFKKLKEKYKGQNIQFMMISFDEDMAAWNKMVTANKDGLFEGVQLATEAYQNDIGKNFNVNGIPHYILIDAEGKIVQKNAMDPYNPKLVSILDGLLKI